MIEKIPFGRTGHDSTRMIFGAAALGAMSQSRADAVLELLMGHGVNHIDTAASYGDSELRVAPWLKAHRSDFFLATKTGERTKDQAREQLHRSLERLETDHVDLIQMHNLTDRRGWETAMGPGGALEALIDARDEGLTRFIGVTGHGTYAAEMHIKSLEEFDFDSVLTPYNFAMLEQPQYREDVEALISLCHERGVAVQTIKGIARRRWTDDDPDKRYSWYMPLRDEAPLRRAVHYVLSRAGLFLTTSSDATLLPQLLAIADDEIATPSDDEMQADTDALGVEPLFVRGVTDQV